MDALRFGIRLLLELIPLFLAISLVVHLVMERVTPARVRALLGGRSRWMGVPLAAVLGALTPFCSCSTVPLVEGMRRAGIPVASVITFLLASPLISPVAVGLLWGTFGAGYAALYTAAGIAFAMSAALVVERWYGPEMAPATPAPPPGGTAASRLIPVTSRLVPAAPKSGVAFATVPLRLAPTTMAGAVACGSVCLPAPGTSAVPSVAAAQWRDSVVTAAGKAWGDLRKLWIALVLAVAVGAVIHGVVPADLLVAVAGPETIWAIPLAAILGVPVYASVVVLLPLGSTLLAKGVGIGAVTAFLMGASGFSIPEGILLSRVLPRGLLIRVLVAFAVGVMAIGILFQAFAG
jgi:uncharacterized protein